ncbi:MAG: UbiA family prenyltransferase [Planctomycetes bacterium]|nr:UbiA family prenyltransferase [Planctomycetota bacterium]
MSDKATPSLALAAEGRNSIGAFLKLFRISNVPTVVTNSLVGASIAAAMEPGTFPNLAHLAAVTLGVLMIYIAGMAINDYLDQVVDARERPDRPIPSAQISSNTALFIGVGLLAMGMFACTLMLPVMVPWVLLLGSAVLAYNMLHLAKFSGPLLMGVCRGLVPVITAIALAPNQSPDWTILVFFAMPLGLATGGISLAARNEMSRNDGRPAWRRNLRTMGATAFIAVAAVAPLGAIAMRVLPPMDTFMAATYLVSLALTGFAIYRGLVRIVRPKATHAGVMHWIAALSLMDAANLCILNQPGLAYAAIGCFILTTLMQRRIAGS